MKLDGSTEQIFGREHDGAMMGDVRSEAAQLKSIARRSFVPF
jgi:hypothetical protein